MIKELHLKTVFWLAVGTWALTLFIQGVPIGAALLKPSGIVFGAVTLLVAAFDRFVWKWRIFRPWFVSTPNLEGTYKGFIAPAGGGSTDVRRIEAFLSVHQTLSGSTIRLMTEESASVSLCSMLSESKDGHWELMATYRNEPKLSLQGSSRIHHGTMRMQVHHPRLEGNYFTDRNTSGELEFELISSRLSRSFEDAKKLVEDGKSRGSK